MAEGSAPSGAGEVSGHLQKKRKLEGGEDAALMRAGRPAVFSALLDALPFDIRLQIIRFYGIALFVRFCDSLQWEEVRSLVPGLEPQSIGMLSGSSEDSPPAAPAAEGDVATDALDGEAGATGDDDPPAPKKKEDKEVVLAFGRYLPAGTSEGCSFAIARPEGIRLANIIKSRDPSISPDNIVDAPPLPTFQYRPSTADWNAIDRFLVRGFYGYFRRDVCRTLFLLSHCATFDSSEISPRQELAGGTMLMRISSPTGNFDLWRLLPRRPALDALSIDSVGAAQLRPDGLCFSVPPFCHDAFLKGLIEVGGEGVIEHDLDGMARILRNVPKIRIGIFAIANGVPSVRIDVEQLGISFVVPLHALLECRSVRISHIRTRQTLNMPYFVSASKNSLRNLTVVGDIAGRGPEPIVLASCPSLTKVCFETEVPPAGFPDVFLRRLTEVTANCLGLLPQAFGLFANLRRLVLHPSMFSSSRQMWKGISDVLRIGRLENLSLFSSRQEVGATFFDSPIELPENSSLSWLQMAEGVSNTLSSLRRCQGITYVRIYVAWGDELESVLDSLRLFSQLNSLELCLRGDGAVAISDRVRCFLEGLEFFMVHTIRSEVQWNRVLEATRGVRSLILALCSKLWTIDRVLESVSAGPREELRLLSTMDEMRNFSGPGKEAVRAQVEPVFRRSSIRRLHLKWRCCLEVFPPVYRQFRLDWFQDVLLE